MPIRPGYGLKGGVSPSHLFSHRVGQCSPTEEYAWPLASPPTWRQRHMKVRGRVDRIAVAKGWQIRALSDCLDHECAKIVPRRCFFEDLNVFELPGRVDAQAHFDDSNRP